MSLRRLLGSPLTALSSFSLLVAWPVLRAGYPSIGDGLNHFYRLVEFDHLLHHGVWFPRWATDLGYGYGYPLFNYYPPLAYYLGVLFHALGLEFAHSLLAVYVLSLALAVTGAYVLARDGWGENGGLIAAWAYGLSPYLYFNVLARGALPETLGLGLLPWVLWVHYRLARQPGAGGFLTATLLYASLILSHLLSALIAAPLVFVFALISESGDREAPLWGSRSRPKNLRFTFSSFLLSLSLSAYFLLPAVLETGYVRIDQLTLPSDLDFHNNFLTVGQLFSLPQPFDPRLVFIAVPPSLSLAALALAVSGLMFRPWVGGRPRTADGRRQAADFGLRRSNFVSWDLGVGISFLAFCLLTLPIAVPLWERLPFANLIQFPWRLVGPASLLLALLAASASSLRPPALTFGIWNLGFGIFLSSLFLFSLTWTFASRFDTPASPTVRDLTAYEAAGQLGTTSAGEFLPRAVHALPPPDSLSAAYAESQVINRLGALPAGVSLVSQSAGLTSASAEATADLPATLTFGLFYFPGWRATVDGRPAHIRVSYPHGLITVPITGGRHTVAIHFGPTPLRAVATIISILSLIILAVIVYRSRPHTSKTRSVPAGQAGYTPTHPHREAPLRSTPLGLWGTHTLIPLALLLLRLTLIDGRETIFARTRFDGATVSGAGQTLDVNFENQLVLIGLDLPHTTVTADETMSLDLYWRAQSPVPIDYSSTVQVVDESGNLFGQSDSQHPGRVPTSRWRLDQYARDAHRLTLLPGTPPGAYRLIAAVYQYGGLALSVLDESQVPQGQAYTLGTLTITRARRPPTQLGAAQPLDLALGPLTLLGYTLNTNTPLAGDELRLTLFWRAEAASRPDVRLRLELTAPDSTEVIHSMETDPARSDYPTSAWTRGEVVRAPLRFRVPAGAMAGEAALRLSLVSSDGARIAGPGTIAALDLRIPDRSFDVPTISHPLDAELGGLVKLLGYDLTPDGLKLYWQALDLMEVSYTVFVHALDAEGHIVAQVDSIPINGARSTTGWLPGEVITDPYSIALSEAVEIEVGLYDAKSGERLGTVVIDAP